MAAVIHSLWEKGDRNPLILPGNVAIDDMRVQSELTRYLPDNWVPVIEKDVDGPNSLSLKIDSEQPNLGKFSACRRVARTIYMGSAPTTEASHKGIEDRRVKLGCVMPGESPAVFGDALRRMASTATYLYPDGTHYWYSTQPTVTKLADDRAEQLKREPDKVTAEIERRLRQALDQRGDFTRIHLVPQTGADVPDDLDTRLVVLGSNQPYSKGEGSEAELTAKAILESRGTVPRIYRNTLVFMAADKTRLQDLDEAVRKYLAWQSILNEQNNLNLNPFQVSQADTQKRTAESAMTARLPETWQWLLVPVQHKPQDALTWEVIRVTSSDSLAIRASKKLRSDMLLLSSYAPTVLKLELDRVPLWRGDHVPVRQLVEDFARYLYLPRLREPSVLLQTITTGLGLLTWAQESFGIAESFDEENGRYKGLQGGVVLTLTDPYSPELLVKPDVTFRQLEADLKRRTEEKSNENSEPATDSRQVPLQTNETQQPGTQTAASPKRFHGTVTLDTTRVGRDAGKIAEEVISHLAGIVGSKVTITLEIEAEMPGGVPENIVRTVTENSRTLRFTSQGFELE